LERGVGMPSRICIVNRLEPHIRSDSVTGLSLANSTVHNMVVATDTQANKRLDDSSVCRYLVPKMDILLSNYTLKFKNGSRFLT